MDSELKEQRPEQSAEALLALWRRRRQFHQALSLAWIGDLGGAEARIAGIEGMAESPACLDLLARIRAQQGRLDEARSLWIAATQLEPTSAYQAALERARTWRGRPSGSYWLPLWVGGGVVAIVTIAWLRWPSGPIATDAANRAPTIASSTAQPDSVPTAAEVMPGRSPRSGRHSLAIHTQGVQERRDGSETILVFEEGLFAAGTEMAPGARARLEAVAAAIRPRSAEFVVTIVGHTDGLGVPGDRIFRDNISLGLARAVIAAEHLRAAGLPAESLSVRSLEPMHAAPYPHDSENARFKNRTVVIRLTPRPPPGETKR